MHTYIYRYMSLCVYIYTHKDVTRTYVQPCKHACMHAYVRTYMHTHPSIHPSIQPCTHMYTLCTDMQVCRDICTHACADAFSFNMHPCTNPRPMKASIHTCIQSRMCVRVCTYIWQTCCACVIGNRLYSLMMLHRLSFACRACGLVT